MDEKLNAALKGIYDSLTDEQKAKAKACKTMEELTALAAKEGVELPDEALNMVAGGAGGCGDDAGDNGGGNHVMQMGDFGDRIFA